MLVLPTTLTRGFSVRVWGKHRTTPQIIFHMTFTSLALRRILWVRESGPKHWKVSWGISQTLASSRWVTVTKRQLHSDEEQEQTKHLHASRWRFTHSGTFGLWCWPSQSMKTGSLMCFQIAWRRGLPTLWVSSSTSPRGFEWLITKVHINTRAHWGISTVCRKQGSRGSIFHVQRDVFRLCQQSLDFWKWEKAQVSSV